MVGLLCVLFLACCLTISIGQDGCFATSSHSPLAFSASSGKKRSVLPQDKILKSLTYYKLDKALSQDLIDCAETALKSWSDQPSVFLSQPEQKAVSEAFKDLIGLNVEFAGGFQGAENCRAIFQKAAETQEYYEGEEKAAVTKPNFNVDEFIAVLNIEGNFLFEKATYGDFKSALINSLGGDKGQVNYGCTCCAAFLSAFVLL